LGFALKAGECLRVTGDVFWEKLESNESMKPCVLSFVDDTHPAASQLLDDAVVRDGLTDHGSAGLRVQC